MIAAREESKPPEFVLALLRSSSDGKTAEVIGIHYGERGYHTSTYGRQTQEWVNEMNARLEIEDAVVMAFEVCSMFGTWSKYAETVEKMKAAVINVSLNGKVA